MIVKYLEKLSVNQLQKLEPMSLNCQNWKAYHNNNSKCSFRIAYHGTKIALYYEVWEKDLIANTKANNEEVYKDSCVEFFIKGDSFYVNFEFSLSLCALVQKGTKRNKRIFFENDKINTIKRNVVRKKNFWSLFAIIDLEEFDLMDKDKFIQEMNFKCNAYCVNETSPHPHFLSLFPIKSRNPDFHKPNYFQGLEFEVPHKNNLK